MISRHQNHTAYYGFLFLFYLFMLKDWLEAVLPYFGYADELIALIAVPFALIKLIRRHFKLYITRNSYWIFIVLFVLCGLLGNLIYHYQPFVQAALPDLFICLKFWLAIETGKILFRQTNLGIYYKQIFFHVRLITWVYLLLLIGDYVLHLFRANMRFGIRSAHLFYSHPMIFAANIVFLMTLLLILYEKVQKKTTFYFILLSVLGCLTLRSSMLGTIAVFWLLWYLILHRKKRVTLKTFLLFIPVVLLIGWSQVEYYFLSELNQDSARYQLLVKSIRIANDHPLTGSGFGTFGSHYSGVFYSPLYQKYGLSKVWGLSRTRHNFLSDSFWPMVLGQTGWIGLLCMAAAIIKLYKQIQTLQKKKYGFYAGCLFALIYLLLCSISSSGFVHPTAIPFALLIGYCMSHGESSPE